MRVWLRETILLLHDPNSVTPVSRVCVSNKNLTVSAGKWFCSACRQVSLKRSIIANHKESKTKIMRKERRERDIAGALAVYDGHKHPRPVRLSQLISVHKSWCALDEVRSLL